MKDKAMALSMRAIKTFTGRKGESRRPDNLVQGGDDFNVEDQKRADYLEGVGLAVPLIASRVKQESAPVNKMEPPLQNKAAQSGPLPSTGGRTGAPSGAFSLSEQDRVQPKRGSRKPRDDAE